jgi:hypothetical protein
VIQEDDERLKEKELEVCTIFYDFENGSTSYCVSGRIGELIRRLLDNPDVLKGKNPLSDYIASLRPDFDAGFYKRGKNITKEPTGGYKPTFAGSNRAEEQGSLRRIKAVENLRDNYYEAREIGGQFLRSLNVESETVRGLVEATLPKGKINKKFWDQIVRYQEHTKDEFFRRFHKEVTAVCGIDIERELSKGLKGLKINIGAIRDAKSRDPTWYEPEYQEDDCIYSDPEDNYSLYSTEDTLVEESKEDRLPIFSHRVDASFFRKPFTALTRENPFIEHWTTGQLQDRKALAAGKPYIFGTIKEFLLIRNEQKEYWHYKTELGTAKKHRYLFEKALNWHKHQQVDSNTDFDDNITRLVNKQPYKPDRPYHAIYVYRHWEQLNITFLRETIEILEELELREKVYTELRNRKWTASGKKGDEYEYKLDDKIFGFSVVEALKRKGRTSRLPLAYDWTLHTKYLC